MVNSVLSIEDSGNLEQITINTNDIIKLLKIIVRKLDNQEAAKPDEAEKDTLTKSKERVVYLKPDKSGRKSLKISKADAAMLLMSHSRVKEARP